ncbi:hypothetical protein BCR42DRAFT_430080 [Absidia repens]|uniref:Uncharacterized protein n=1 Tax=Absidia repens TaxID=90262 RepID=A0A1X2HKF9_9FUNG|nr:hypothetical protein BCR42DRAFT_430080 [Absidia repens]
MPMDIDEELILDGFAIADANKQQPTIYDFEAIRDDDDKRLWLIRVPEQVPKTSLVSMRIKQSQPVGTPLSTLYVDDKDAYALYRVPKGKSLDDDVGVSGHEMFGFSCLVPCRDKKGKMVFAPRKISKCFTLNEEVSIPDGAPLASFIRNRPVVKRQQPKGLSMRLFKPYGFDTCDASSNSSNSNTTDLYMDSDFDIDRRTRKKAKGNDDDKDTYTDKKRKKMQRQWLPQ